jgi:hypothetical protein
LLKGHARLLGSHAVLITRLLQNSFAETTTLARWRELDFHYWSRPIPIL